MDAYTPCQWASPHIDKYSVLCSECHRPVNIKSGAKFNLDRHGSTDMHKKAVEDNKSQKKGGSLRTLMLTKNANPSEEKILKAEMVHIIKLALNKRALEEMKRQLAINSLQSVFMGLGSQGIV